MNTAAKRLRLKSVATVIYLAFTALEAEQCAVDVGDPDRIEDAADARTALLRLLDGANRLVDDLDDDPDDDLVELEAAIG